MASTNTGITPVDTRAGGCHNHGVPRVFASWTKLARLAAAPIGLAVAVGALLIAAGPGMFTTYAGRSGLAAGLMVAAGLALVLAGLLASQASRTGRAGDLAVLAGLVWFAPVWVGWELGPPLVRSIGMLAAGFAFPLLFYLILAFPGGPAAGPPVPARWPGRYAWRPPWPRSASRSSVTRTLIPPAGPTAPTMCFSSGRFRPWREQ